MPTPPAAPSVAPPIRRARVTITADATLEASLLLPPGDHAEALADALRDLEERLLDAGFTVADLRLVGGSVVEVAVHVVPRKPGRPCRACAQLVWWAPSSARPGGWIAVNRDGTPHLGTCPGAAHRSA